jgi:hypothetical protein
MVGSSDCSASRAVVEAELGIADHDDSRGATDTLRCLSKSWKIERIFRSQWLRVPR